MLKLIRRGCWFDAYGFPSPCSYYCLFFISLKTESHINNRKPLDKSKDNPVLHKTMKVFLLSDIHGNKTALNTVFEYIKARESDGLILLGDLIDYGPHSNEVISMLENCNIPILCNIQGNHEDAILRDRYSRFSSPRGVISAKYTKSLLTEKSLYYLTKVMKQDGKTEFALSGKKCIAIHGCLDDDYWGKFSLDKNLENYSVYDFVFTGHSHKPHFFEFYSKIQAPKTRNLKKTIFINPGSVGQPRNLNPKTQFVYLDTETENIEFIKLDYDIIKEQNAFSTDVDSFYKKRLEAGI